MLTHKQGVTKFGHGNKCGFGITHYRQFQLTDWRIEGEVNHKERYFMIHTLPFLLPLSLFQWRDLAWRETIHTKFNNFLKLFIWIDSGK